MKLKYYLRGLGVGMAVTAIVLSLSFAGRDRKLSDEEVRVRAKEMGLTEAHEVLAERKAGEADVTSMEAVETIDTFETEMPVEDNPEEDSVSEDSIVSVNSTVSSDTVSNDTVSDSTVSDSSVSGNSVSTDGTYHPEP